MKKILSLIGFCTVISAFIVIQMLVAGNKSSAQNIVKNKAKYSVYESEYSKLKLTSVSNKKIIIDKSKVTLINFWAAWCLPCIAEFESLTKLVSKYPKKLQVIGINNDDEDPKKTVLKTQQKHNLNFDSVLDPSGVYAEKFHVTTVPATIMYFKGRVIFFSDTETDFMDKKIFNIIEKNFKK